MIDKYLTHPSYLKIDGKPVVMILVGNGFAVNLGVEQAKAEFDRFEHRCKDAGLPGVYLVFCEGAIGSTDWPTVMPGWDRRPWTKLCIRMRVTPVTFAGKAASGQVFWSTTEKGICMDQSASSPWWLMANGAATRCIYPEIPTGRDGSTPSGSIQSMWKAFG